MEEMIRAVLDSNILARAAKRSNGPAREVLSGIRSHPHCLVVSPFILNELERVLNYPRVRNMHGLNQEEIQAYLAELYGTAEVVELSSNDPAEAISSDPDDNPIIQTAVVGRASVICTLDRHFREPAVMEYCAAKNIRILTDIEFLKVLRELTA